MIWENCKIRKCKVTRISWTDCVWPQLAIRSATQKHGCLKTWKSRLTKLGQFAEILHCCLNRPEKNNNSTTPRATSLLFSFCNLLELTRKILAVRPNFVSFLLSAFQMSTGPHSFILKNYFKKKEKTGTYWSSKFKLHLTHQSNTETGGFFWQKYFTVQMQIEELNGVFLI